MVDHPSVAQAQDRLRDLQARYDQLLNDHGALANDRAQARLRFAMVLAQLANFDRLAAGGRLSPSFGQVCGALIDVPRLVMGALMNPSRRAECLGLARSRLVDHAPRLLAFVQRLRGRPLIGPARSPFDVVIYEPVRLGDRPPVVELSNLFLDRRTREAVREACQTLLAHIGEHGPARALIALNFDAGGGAERTAQAYAAANADEGGSIIMLLTDLGPRRRRGATQRNVFTLDFDDFGVELDDEERLALVFLLLHAVGPQVLHIVNSVAAWRMLVRVPRTVVPAARIFASLFALQFETGTGEPVGFAAEFLPRTVDKLDAILTDNRRFAEQGPQRLGVALRDDQIFAIYNACRLEGEVSEKEALRRLSARIEDLGRATRLSVVWAGRLDLEKRVDLLYEIALQCEDFANFRVYGSEVVSAHDWGARLGELPNVWMMGAFTSPQEWEKGPGLAHAFLFTSVWEGMPNALIEAAWLGLPCVAATVGGVGELLDVETGWPIEPNAPPEVYVSALRAILASSDEAATRTRRLLARTHHRHVRASFDANVRDVYRREVGAL
jgi:glycosyltransferase involved in cell wall biosynthesis